MNRLPHGAAAEVARFCGKSRTYVSHIAHSPLWRSADPFLIRQLYTVGWSPVEGRTVARLWINKQSLKLRRKSKELAVKEGA